jgi:hypothetical protein
MGKSNCEEVGRQRTSAQFLIPHENEKAIDQIGH